MATITWAGVVEQQRIFRELARSAQVQGAVSRVARLVQAEAVRRAPVLTGRLRESIVVVPYHDQRTDYPGQAVAWDLEIAPYGPVVEFGSEDTAAQPHMRPAADAFGANRRAAR